MYWQEMNIAKISFSLLIILIVRETENCLQNLKKTATQTKSRAFSQKLGMSLAAKQSRLMRSLQLIKPALIQDVADKRDQ